MKADRIIGDAAAGASVENHNPKARVRRPDAVNEIAGAVPLALTLVHELRDVFDKSLDAGNKMHSAAVAEGLVLLLTKAKDLAGQDLAVYGEHARALLELLEDTLPPVPAGHAPFRHRALETITSMQAMLGVPAERRAIAGNQRAGGSRG